MSPLLITLKILAYFLKVQMAALSKKCTLLFQALLTCQLHHLEPQVFLVVGPDSTVWQENGQCEPHIVKENSLKVRKTKTEFSKGIIDCSMRVEGGNHIPRI